MRITVRLFAAARQLAEREQIVVECSGEATVAELRKTLIAEIPQLEPLLAHVRFAVNAAYAEDSTVLTADDDVACIPPVSGG